MEKLALINYIAKAYSWVPFCEMWLEPSPGTLE